MKHVLRIMYYVVRIAWAVALRLSLTPTTQPLSSIAIGTSFSPASALAGRPAYLTPLFLPQDRILGNPSLNKTCRCANAAPNLG
jgi:hypothetical protein